ncbi:MAG: glycosyltransferase family 2 protein [Clostridiales bacterium]|uniref:glycosyltransferase family 2 protein n=1 Tax=Clostridia TaxID=186801 RepID=UPI002671C253|nr:MULTISPECIES: glycosyltransferase family 2 protein [Clostridia]MDD7753090.1 glycosyltransferase family 2 protein [Clostridiales bacterium]MCI6458683.1 glycosyltransferase family 2 protein [Clostridium sp.]MCI7030732.1 glycosyltransferase family 2 protein [Clostridium sp.]MDY4135991.1 glycosyltransferase family 2 protein [Terrisporobacter sp.]MDY4737315.1 glycosyltransferase family 2 protein [Terrisporobacter sp.]
MSKVAAIIVSYNPDKNLLDSVNLLISQVEKIIIVDNGSIEEKRKDISSIKDIDNERIEVIFNEENLGIATALNIGVREALKQGFNWILTMDQDSKASKDMVEKMFEVYNNIDEKERKSILSIFPNFVDERIQSIEENSVMNTYEYVDADITSGNLVKAEVFDKVGFFDDSLFIDLVDTDFCMRLNEKNIKMIKVRDAILYHSLGESQSVKSIFGKFNTSNHSALRRYYMTRNRFYIWEKYKDLNSFTLNRDKKLFKKEFIKIILGEKDKVNKIKMVFKGYKDYKKGIRGKLK